MSYRLCIFARENKKDNMCGIVGYIGKREAYPILIKGLKRLKYRGYDSAGVAIINDNQLLKCISAARRNVRVCF